MTDETAIESLRQLLRTATREAHHRIDHHPLMAPMRLAVLSRRHYGDILLALYALHVPIERVFARYRGDHGEQPTSHSALIASDLGHLGRKAELDLPAEIPQWSERFPSSPSDYVGMRYVIEGSHMGRRIIGAQLAGRLAGGCKDVARFFDPELDDRDWQRFWRTAGQMAGLNADKAVVGALRLFAEIETLFDRHVHFHES
jgi:heme oxygenase